MIQDFGLFRQTFVFRIDRCSVYSGYFRRDFPTLELYFKFSLYRIPVYTEFQFIQNSSLYRIPVYSGFQFKQDSSLYRIPVYTGFQFIQDSSLYRNPVYSEFGLDRFRCMCSIWLIMNHNRRWLLYCIIVPYFD